MCGRYSLSTPADTVGRLFEVETIGGLRPRYNIAPTQPAPVIRQHDGIRRLAMPRWGLIPSWAKDAASAARMINARAETVCEKPAFRGAMAARRCLVPADGFYEWRRRGGNRQPYRICPGDGRPFAFAGLWELWRDPAAGGAPVETYAIVTTAAAEGIAHIHHRMPVILAATAHAAWLGGTPDDARMALSQSCRTDLVARPVSPRVGDIRNDDPQLLEPWIDPEPALF